MCLIRCTVDSSVAGLDPNPNPDQSDPNPDPSDPNGFLPPRSGSGSINQRHGSGSGSFFHQAKIVRKTLIPTVLLLLFDFLFLKNDVSLPSKSNMQINFFKTLVFCRPLEGQ